jgi:hypothetical protein
LIASHGIILWGWLVLCIDLKTKKADVAEHPEVFHHVGLLIDEPPGKAGLPFIQSSDVVYKILPYTLRNAN